MQATRLGAKWTAMEDVLIRELYPDHSGAYIAELIDRTRGAVQQRAMKLGVRKCLPSKPERFESGSIRQDKREFCLVQKCPYARRMPHGNGRCYIPICMREEGGGLGGSAT